MLVLINKVFNFCNTFYNVTKDTGSSMCCLGVLVPKFISVS